MSINLELYKVFYYVAIELSFSQASKKLFLSQSAVSQSIAQLESELNTKLFIRTTKKVKLTSDGELLLRHIEPAINNIFQGEKKIEETTSLKNGKLHIGVSDTICKYYLIPHLKIFHETYPQIELLITNRTSIECVELLKKHQVDLILTNLPNASIDSTINIIEIMEFGDIIIAPIQYQEALSHPVELKELLQYPILLLDQQSSTTQHLLHVFALEHLLLHPSIELGSIDLLIEMAKIGLGITFIPDYIRISSKDLCIVNTRQPLQKRKLGVATQAKTPLSNATTAFIAQLTETI